MYKTLSGPGNSKLCKIGYDLRIDGFALIRFFYFYQINMISCSKVAGVQVCDPYRSLGARRNEARSVLVQPGQYISH